MSLRLVVDNSNRVTVYDAGWDAGYKAAQLQWRGERAYLWCALAILAIAFLMAI